MTDNDIVTRLRETPNVQDLAFKAADTIEAQDKEIARLKAELDDWKKKALTKWMDSHD